MPLTKQVDSRSDRADLYDALIIGAGVAGIYQLYRLKKLGMRVRLLEAGNGVGGVWHWNRYPGARLDSESYSYAYSFSKDLLGEWSWSEHFAAQPELKRYFDFVVDRLGLREDVQLNAFVTSAHLRDDGLGWTLALETGEQLHARFVIAAVGPLSTPTYPNVKGRESFSGACYHTSRWPDGSISFAGKRVAVIGTGATGIQVIQEAAKSAARLTVFQRTPNYCAPLNNEKIPDAEQQALKSRYPEIIAGCRASNSWFIHDPDPRSVFDLSDAERDAHLHKLYAEKGIGIWKANFHDIATNPEANEIVSNFMRDRIRERVKDPAVAEKLVPKTFGFGTRRVPLETNYYEVYNQPNVELVDLNETPIEEITPGGIRTTTGGYPLDIIVFATGFDAVTGSFDRMDIRGIDGVRLREKWRDGPESFLGVHTAGFPNFFMPGGPLASVGNFTPALEYSVDWISDLLTYMRAHDFNYVDARPEAEAEWTNLVRSGQEHLLMGKVKSWFTGVNSNIEGRDTPRVLTFVGSAKNYRARCDEVKAGGYAELEFHKLAEVNQSPALLSQAG